MSLQNVLAWCYVANCFCKFQKIAIVSWGNFDINYVKCKNFWGVKFDQM